MNKISIKITTLLLTLTLFGCNSNDGRVVESSEIKMRVRDGYIQYYTGSKWDNLIATEELKGEKGDKGDKGEKGDSGVAGKNGTNGINGKDGINGVNGKNGKDGSTIQNNITKGFNISIAYSNINPDYYSDYGSLVLVSQDKAIVSSYFKSEIDESNITGIYALMNENGSIEIEAKPKENWKFVKWSDGSTKAKRTISYNDNQYLTAYFDCAKTPLTSPNLKSREVDYKTKDLTLTWTSDKNAKNYVVTLNDGQSFTSLSNSLTIPSNKLKNYSRYVIKIKAIPDDTALYMESVVADDYYYYDDYEVMTVVPYFVQGVTTLDEYKILLNNAGLDVSVYPESITYVTDGATDKNNGTIASVSPEAGSKIKARWYENNTSLSVYHVHSDGDGCEPNPTPMPTITPIPIETPTPSPTVIATMEPTSMPVQEESSMRKAPSPESTSESN